MSLPIDHLACSHLVDFDHRMEINNEAKKDYINIVKEKIESLPTTVVNRVNIQHLIVTDQTGDEELADIYKFALKTVEIFRLQLK